MEGAEARASRAANNGRAGLDMEVSSRINFPARKIDMSTYVVVGLVVVFGLAILSKFLQKSAVCPHCGDGSIRTLFASLPASCDKCGDYARIVQRPVNAHRLCLRGGCANF